MSVLNTKPQPILTHEGAVAQRVNPEQQLRRSVCACLLWENTFYEDGVSIAERIEQEAKLAKPDVVAQLAIEAREQYKLRHIPLLLAVSLARQGLLKKDVLARIIQRPDELCEFLAIYWKNGKCSLAGQVKKGLADAFQKFDEYQLAKYNRPNAIKLRDVLFLCHAKPKDDEQAGTWKNLVDGTLESPDTWEVNLSDGKDKKETWERMLRENKLGALALLRNLRNMKDAKVEESLIFAGLESMKVDRVLPFRFIAAARYAPQWEPQIETAMLRCLQEQPKFKGKTAVLVDISGSMYGGLSGKSDMSRIDAACGLAICVREMCDDVAVYSFSQNCIRIAPRRGFALRDAISNSLDHGCTYLGKAVNQINSDGYDRLIVITDEQSRDTVPGPVNKGYMINVASCKNGIGYGKWTHLDGFSESILKYIKEYEAL